MSDQGITRLVLENTYKKPGEEKKFQLDNRIYGTTSEASSNQLIESLVAKEKQRGFEQGHKEAVETVQAEWNLKLSQLNELLATLEQPLRDFDQEVQDKVLEIAIAVATQIVRRELTLDSGQIVSAVKQAIELIPKDGQQINIYINPSDEDHIKSLFAQNGESSKFNLIQDPTISVGGCRATTDYSLVDLTIEKQIALIAAKMFGEQRKSSN